MEWATAHFHLWVATLQVMLRQEGLRACVHDRPAVRTTEPVRLRPSSGRATEGHYRDRAFSVAIEIIGFHIATWSTMSRHGSSAARVAVSRQGMSCRDRVPRQAGRVRSR